MMRVGLGLLAACWLLVGVGVWRAHRHDATRRAPRRWHRAVDTLSAWSAEHDEVPVAATWCRPIVQPALVTVRELPRQRQESADRVVSRAPGP